MTELSLAQKIAIWALPILFAITLHEAAHGWVAFKRGDNTAFLAGRISLNPLKHIDLFGTIILPTLLLVTSGFMFGWAKPVPVDTRQLKNIRWDSALVAAAGPLANLLMALFWAGISKLGMIWVVSLQAHHSAPDHALWLFMMGQAGISINLFLLLLNLIPIPPLDGSRVVASLLPARARYLYMQLERFGFVILIAMLFLGALNPIISPLFNGLQAVILKLFQIT